MGKRREGKREEGGKREMKEGQWHLTLTWRKEKRTLIHSEESLINKEEKEKRDLGSVIVSFEGREGKLRSLRESKARREKPRYSY